MIRQIRTNRVNPGKNREAIAWTQKAVNHLKANYPAIQSIQAFNEAFGNVGTTIVCVDYENMAATDTVAAQVATDETYQAMIAEAASAGLFIPGTVHDTLGRSI